MKEKFGEWVFTWDSFLHNSTKLIKEYILKERKFLFKNVSKDKSILDAGCGNGEVIQILQKKSRNITGIDVNKRIISKTKRRFSSIKSIKIDYGNITKTKFNDSSFDYIIFSMNTLGNLNKYKKQALKESVRIVKANGKIIFSVYSEKALNERLRSYLNSNIKYKIINKSKGKIKLFSSFDTKKPIITEQFSKEDIIKLIKNIGQYKIKIKRLNSISYICILNVIK
jgi:ubiquinone/menaquinone biosynthesis C-methylase UbiE